MNELTILGRFYILLDDWVRQLDAWVGTFPEKYLNRIANGMIDLL